MDRARVGRRGFVAGVAVIGGGAVVGCSAEDNRAQGQAPRRDRGHAEIARIERAFGLEDLSRFTPERSPA